MTDATSDPGRAEPRPVRHALSSGVELHALHWDPPSHAAQLPPWLLVHGLASNARLWDGVAWRLAQRGHPVVAVDQRGHGLSSKPDDGFDMGTVADDLRLLIDGLGWERPMVAGQSWGGNVVLELAHRHPLAVSGIAGIDGGLIELRKRFPDWEDARVVMAPPRLLGTPVAQVRAWLEQTASDWPEEGRLGQLANCEVRSDGTIAPWLTFERHIAVLRGLWEHSPAAICSTISVPVLLVTADTGNADWAASKAAAVASALSVLPRCRAEWFHGAHHDVHAQHPEEVASLLHRAATEPDFFLSGAQNDAPAADLSDGATRRLTT
jgi:pimeloyl-ACP methyl ester carboxylesterase